MKVRFSKFPLPKKLVKNSFLLFPAISVFIFGSVAVGGNPEKASNYFSTRHTFQLILIKKYSTRSGPYGLSP